MIEVSYRAKDRSYDEIRRYGAIGSVNEGPVINMHGIEARLIAWPGNGFQTESVQVFTHHPGQETEAHRYVISETALLCLKGSGEIFLHGQWVSMEAGDLAYVPAGVEHATRHTGSTERDFVLISSICPPPPFGLYTPEFYEKGQGIKNHGTMRLDKIEEAIKSTPDGNISAELEMHLNESTPEVRAWNLSVEEIQKSGALFNAYRGGQGNALLASMIFILWPGYGPRSTGFNSAYVNPGETSTVHRHIMSDECLFNFGPDPVEFYCGDRWLRVEANECVLAPCGVMHGSRGLDARAQVGGFASPPQYDVYEKTSLYNDGAFSQPPFGYIK